MSLPTAPVSVLVPTRNEAPNIVSCLEGLGFSDDVVVVDSASDDGTPELARQAGARVVTFEWNGHLPKKKNWALEHVEWAHPWVLVLDADERVPEALASEIVGTLKDARHAGYYLNRRLIFMGRPIRHCGYYPSWNLRLFRHELGRYERMVEGDTASGDNEVHEHVVLTGSAGRLGHDLLHYAYPDIATWVEKHNRYSSWEAAVEVRGACGAAGIGALAGRRRLRRLTRRLPLRPSLRFLYGYVWKLGFLDGRAGYVLCRLIATYELLNVLKAEELRLRDRPSSA